MPDVRVTIRFHSIACNEVQFTIRPWKLDDAIRDAMEAWTVITGERWDLMPRAGVRMEDNLPCWKVESPRYNFGAIHVFLEFAT